MIKDIIFNKGTLTIFLEGKITKRNINILRKKIYYISKKYGFKNIIVHLDKITLMDSEAFYDFLDEYDDKVGGNLVIEKQGVLI